MRQLLPAIFLCFLTTCSTPSHPFPSDAVNEDRPNEDWGVWVSKLEAAVSWPRETQDVMDLSFPARASTLQETLLPDEGHQPWLDCPDMVARADLLSFCADEDTFDLVRRVPFAKGEVLLLKHYRGTPLLYPVQTLVYRNNYGRCFTVRAQVSIRPARVEAMVADLGLKMDFDHLKRGFNSNRLLAALHFEPHRSARLLVRELQVVDPVDLSPAARHVMWCIRALESLTDQEFEFMTLEKLTSDQEEFLDAKRPMNFYGAWMSHSKYYMAPKDVQQKVIDAWKSWVAVHGEDFAPAKEPRNYAP